MSIQQNGNGGEPNGRPQRSWEENVRIRGVAILLRMIAPILHDRGDDQGRITKAKVRGISRTPHGEFIFVLEVPNHAERGRLIGPDCRTLSALQALFSTALTTTFSRDDRPRVTVGIWDDEGSRVLMPQRLYVESELEPEGTRGTNEEE